MPISSPACHLSYLGKQSALQWLFEGGNHEGTSGSEQVWVWEWTSVSVGVNKRECGSEQVWVWEWTSVSVEPRVCLALIEFPILWVIQKSGLCCLMPQLYHSKLRDNIHWFIRQCWWNTMSFPKNCQILYSTISHIFLMQCSKSETLD